MSTPSKLIQSSALLQDYTSKDSDYYDSDPNYYCKSLGSESDSDCFTHYSTHFLPLLSYLITKSKCKHTLCHISQRNKAKRVIKEAKNDAKIANNTNTKVDNILYTHE